MLGILRSRYQAKRSLQKVFSLWDKNRDGQISLDEMSQVFEFLGLKHLSRDDIRTSSYITIEQEHFTNIKTQPYDRYDSQRMSVQEEEIARKKKQMNMRKKSTRIHLMC